MKFQLNTAWAIGQFCLASSSIIDLNKPDSELDENERAAKGYPVPLGVTALDADCAVYLWKNFPDLRHLLRRNLDPVQETTFNRLKEISPAALDRAWPSGKG